MTLIFISDIILKAYELIRLIRYYFLAGIMERIVEQNLLYDFMENYLMTIRRRYMKMLFTTICLSARLPMNMAYQDREYMI